MTDKEEYFDENKFWNYGDNPVYKKFMKIAQANGKGGQAIDQRTYYIEKGIRFGLARNWDDYLQRDLKATTFPRAFCVWTVFASFAAYTHRICKRLIPIGRFGVRKINETQFYQSFGWPGVVGVGAWYGAAMYSFYKASKFTYSKFYYRVILQDRDWIHEGLQCSKYGDYRYHDNILTRETEIAKSPMYKVMTEGERDYGSYEGPYAPPAGVQVEQ